ncbi:MAG TPA: DUF3108 domain-containing protein [Usitatibacter sp.]|jgi:hypothetical protein|nr:DUF3108 domain-containing protein [Usitatibacter sp.]
MRLLGFIIALFSSLAAASQPTQIEAQYIVTTNGGITIGRASETFSRTGNVYTIRSETRSDGALKAFLDDQYTVQSTGRVGADGLIPLEYTERRARDNKRDLKSTFDWKMSVMHTELRGEPSDYWFPPGTQDRISIMYQFVYMKELGPTLEIPMADRRKVRVYTYKLVEEGRISTPAGEFETRHYRRVLTDEDDTRVDVWLAKDKYNFPVRVIFDEPRRFKLEQSLAALAAR